MNRGILSAFAAYGLWGLLPVYWKALEAVPAFEILCHRAAWSLVFVALILGGMRHGIWLRAALRSRATLLTFLATSILLSANWLIYIWAVNAGFIVDTSLGYFINPLINVVLGVVFLRERLRPGQAAAIAVATAGVLVLTVSYGTVPWIALSLAVSFGFYGLLRKRATLQPLEGFGLESALIFLPAAGYLLYLQATGEAAFGSGGVRIDLLLVLAGVVTALPLICFAYAAHRVTLTTLGVIQYTAPTLQLLLGILVYGETLTGPRLVTFVMIWVALVIYSVESIAWTRRQQRAMG